MKIMWIECVPNFSEGRDAGKVARIAGAIRGAGVKVLDCTSDADHHRSVITFAGALEDVENAAVAGAAAAVREIDLSRHVGVHPRMGAIDVIPFVPLQEASLEECAALARRVAQRLWGELGLASFFYEAAAGGRPLEDVRRAARAGAPPDIGTGRHATAGAAAIGARKFLVAWNINLHGRDVELAREIARSVRFSGGGFPGVKALGLALESRDRVQVSINSTDFEATPLHVVFEAVSEAARSAGVRVAGSELIGMIPAQALALSEGHDLRWENFRPEMVLENALQLR